MRHNHTVNLGRPLMSQEYPATVQRMATVLRSVYGIANGQDLVSTLGRGYETDNQEALEAWVCDALINLEEKAALQILPYLVCRLGKRLNQLETHND